MNSEIIKMEETKPKISVIVPVYNVEKYLEDCIDSILNQSFEDFELLLINDGSIDSSGRICDEYAKKDKRIKAIHKHNKGVSATRNYGLGVALGDYICFVDSDDWIEKDVLNILYQSSYADLVILTDVSYDYSNHTIVRTSGYSKKIYLKEEITSFLVENNFFTLSEGGAWSKLFRNNILREYDINFMLDNAAYEDTLFTFEYLCKCESVSIVRGSSYHYIHRDSGISLSQKRHPYNNYIESGNKGLKLHNELSKKYGTNEDKVYATLGGITNFAGTHS